MFAVSVLCATMLQCGANGPSVASRLPKLKASGNRIVTETGESIRLRGVHFEDFFVLEMDDTNRDGVPDRHLDRIEADFQRVRALGANVVRVAVYPGFYFLVGASYLPKYLDRAIDLAEKHGVYLIISYHVIGRPGGYYESDQDETLPAYPAKVVYTDTAMAVRFWETVASRYAKRSHVIFEIYNEPVDPTAPYTWADWRPTGETLIAAIRRHSDHLILGPGVEWTSDLRGVPSNPYSDRNLAYVAHVYPGLTPDPATQASEWEQRFGFLSTTYPLIVSEWGFDKNGFDPYKGTVAGFGIPFVDYLDQKGLHWVAFSYASPHYGPPMLEYDWETLTEFGRLVKDRLQR